MTDQSTHPFVPTPASSWDRLLFLCEAIFHLPGAILEAGIRGGFREVIREYRLNCGHGAVQLISKVCEESYDHEICIHLLRLANYDGLLVHVNIRWHIALTRDLDEVFWSGDDAPFDPEDIAAAQWLRFPNLPMPIHQLNDRLYCRVMSDMVRVRAMTLLSECLIPFGVSFSSGKEPASP